MTNFFNELPLNIRSVAERGNINTAEEAVFMPKSKLLLLNSCSEHDLKVLKEAAAKFVAQEVVPVSSLLKPPWSSKWSRISFGCSGLDLCTGGGLLTRGITEICGVSGGGKTQLLLQLSLTVQLPKELGGLGKGVAFICTEDAFPSKRFFQMAKYFTKRYPEQKINYLNNVYIEHVLESDELIECVSERLPKIMSTIDIGLIVIDSVAAIFRIYSDYVKRGKEMRQLASCLLSYADKYECAVVCINQVTAVSEKDSEVPCLGLAWAHLGRTRIKISKVPKQININKSLITVRKFEVMYSPDTPNDFAEFIITEEGVIDVPNQKKLKY